MGCDSQQARCSTGTRGNRDGARSRIGVLLCLLALAFQLTDQAVHMWGVATRRGMVAVPLVLDSVQSSTTLVATNDIPQRLPHNPALCCVCQALSRLQVCLSMQSWNTGAAATGAWLVPMRTAHVYNLSLSATAPRAPPSLS
jgi:hypothetical protein